MSHTIKISDETYRDLSAEAAANGMDTDVWVELKLKPQKKKKLSEKAGQKAWENYIGAYDSSTTDELDKSIPLDKRIKSVFGDAVDKKMKNAGLKALR